MIINEVMYDKETLSRSVTSYQNESLVKFVAKFTNLMKRNKKGQKSGQFFFFNFIMVIKPLRKKGS